MRWNSSATMLIGCALLLVAGTYQSVDPPNVPRLAAADTVRALTGAQRASEPIAGSKHGLFNPDLANGLLLAFLAAVLGVAASVVKTLLDRQRTHYAGLCMLEYLLVLNGDRLARTLHRCQQIRLELSQGVLVFVFPQPFRLDDTSRRDLYNLTIINHAHILNSHMDRFNESLAAWRDAYEHLREARTRNVINESSYKANLKNMQTEIGKLGKYLEVIEGKRSALHARVRAQTYHDEPRIGKLRKLIFKSPDVSNHVVLKQLARINDESKHVTAVFQADIDAVFKATSAGQARDREGEPNGDGE